MINRNCILCEEKDIGYGNNAWPLDIGRCCDKCNVRKVIPERIKIIKEQQKLLRKKGVNKK